MRIIPAIDVIDGKCVRLTNGNYNTKKIYNENPVEVAKEFEDAGIQYLHLVDLDGAKSGHIVNHKILDSIAAKTNLKIDFGGGIQTTSDLEIAFNCGASQITGGSIAVKNRNLFEQWISQYGADKIILGADVKKEKIAISGWTETSEQDVFSFIESYLGQGIKNVICTDVSKDGLLEGPSLLLYEKILRKFPQLNLIASGGVTVIDDLPSLKALGCEAVIIGKAIYESKISLKALQQFIIQQQC